MCLRLSTPHMDSLLHMHRRSCRLFEFRIYLVSPRARAHFGGSTWVFRGDLWPEGGHEPRLKAMTSSITDASMHSNTRYIINPQNTTDTGDIPLSGTDPPILFNSICW